MSSCSVTASNWCFREAGTEKWFPSKRATCTTQIHLDLLDNGLIPDPFIDMTEKDVQWIGEKVWEYSTDVTLPTIAVHTDLILAGLDTFCSVYVNDHKVLDNDNMFHIHRVDIGHVAKKGSNNIRLVFESALLKGRELQKIHGKMKLSNGENSRVQVRKAQYHYGWDWGPLLMTCGPWRPVKIECYDSTIADVFVNAHVKTSLDADVAVEVDVLTDSQVVIDLLVMSPNNDILATGSSTVCKSGISKILVQLSKPELWYPFGYGPQARNRFEIKLRRGSFVIHTVIKEVALRRVELIQRPLIDAPGTSFFFKVNNISVYCAGSCWIPADSFSTRLTSKDYQQWINLMIQGHQNMVRVWGGGYYEEESFYEECDLKGVMVWQDFMFACGQYPAYPEFLQSVTKEFIDQLKRLRNYGSIVIYAGNNEDYQIAEFCDLDYDPKDNSGDWLNTKFPARHIYEILLPKLCSDYHPHVPYHPGSPWGGENSSDPTVGDIHQWNVWHGTQEKYQDWYKLGGRFISEFGMEAFPNRKTIDACITDSTELYPQSETMDHHNKAVGFERRLALYVMENFHVEGMDLDSWIYITQLMQSECLAYAYRCWRREWKGEGREYIAGALVWQINDCWPVTSWAIVDYYKRPKLAYYAVKRESQPIWLGMYRNDITDYPPELVPSDKLDCPFNYTVQELADDIWGVNSTTSPFKGILVIQVFEVESGKMVKELDPISVTLKANQSTELVQNLKLTPSVHEVVYVRLLSEDQATVISRAGDWPQPLKYLKFPKRNVKLKVCDDKIIVSSDKPVKGVEIIVNNRDIFLDDNGIDLFPGEEQTIVAKGLKTTDQVKVRFYKQGL